MRSIGVLAALVLSCAFLPITAARADDPTPTPTAGMLCRADLSAGVYNPQRLQLLHPCQQANGTVVGTRPEADGDTHVYLLLDAGQDALLCGVQLVANPPTLLLEIIPGDGNAVPMPAADDHVTRLGPTCSTRITTGASCIPSGRSR